MVRLLPSLLITPMPLLFLLLAGAAGLQAQDTPPNLTIPHEGDQLTVDDDLNDWAALPITATLEVLQTQNNSGVALMGESDLAATLKMTYDATNLYVLVDVTDDVISTDNAEQPWHNDGIEISLLMTDDAEERTAWSHNSEQPQPGQQKIFYNVGYSKDDVITNSNSVEGDYSNASVTTVMKGTTEAPTGYMVEFVLPWSAVNNGDTGFDPMAEGSRFSVNVAVNDNDNEAFPNNADFDARREHILLLVNANMNNQGELFAFVELGGEETDSANMFSDDPYFGNSTNYTFFANPQGANGAGVEDWMVVDMNGETVLSLENADVNPTHPTGMPFYNPDESLYTNGQFSAPGAGAIAADTSFADFEMLVDIKRPADQTSNFYDVAVFFGYTDADNYSYANFGIHPTDPTSTIVPVVAGEGMRTPADPRFTDVLPVLPNDDEFHTILLRREGSQVAMFIDDTPVMFAASDTFATAGSVGVGSWNDNGIFDNITVAALTGDYPSKMSFITDASIGTVSFDSIAGVEEGTTAAGVLAGITLSPGATAVIMDADDNEVATGNAVAEGSMILVTAEAGNTKAYRITFGSVTTAGPKIERVFPPVTINTDSTELTVTQGADVALLIDKVRAPEGVTEQVLNADGTVITDSTTVLTDGMEYQLVSASGETRNYPIILVAPNYPLVNIAPAEVTIDAFFEDWQAIDQQFAIDGIGTGGTLTDVMPTDDDISGFFKATYDETYLYLYFNITDENLSTSAADAFRNDGIEIALLMPTSTQGRSDYNLFFDQANQPGNQKFVYTYGADWNTTFTNSDLGAFNKPGTLFSGAVVESFAKEDGTGYEVEMQIPWSGLNQNSTMTSDEAVTGMIGDAFSINVSINDNDGGADRQSIRYYAAQQINRDGVDFAIFTLSNTTPTRNVVSDFGLEVFPNPTGGQLQLKTDKEIERVIVYSLTGQVLLQTSKRTLDVSPLEAGPYLMEITTQDRLVKMVRFIKR